MKGCLFITPPCTGAWESLFWGEFFYLLDSLARTSMLTHGLILKLVDLYDKQSQPVPSLHISLPPLQTREGKKLGENCSGLPMTLNRNGRDTKKSSPRVALVTNVLSHYRVPCFARLAEIMSGQMTFFLLAEKMEHRSYIIASEGHGLPIRRLRGWRWSNHPHDDLHLNDPRPVCGGDFDLIILGGWGEPTYLLLWLWAVLSQKKLIFLIESTGYERFRSWPKEKFKKFLLRSAAGCIVPGKRSLEYCRRLGMSEDRIFLAPNSVDRDYFRNQAEKLLPLKNTLRESANLKEFVILFVGRLVESIKGVSTLIKACGELERKGRKITLFLAGDGPDGGSYRELARREGLTDVRFLGFLNYEVLCQYYAMAHVLVLPSYSEPWGMVLNEGMEFGLPLVVSEAVGAGADLVNPGKNGFVIPVGNASALAHALEKLAKDDNLRFQMGEASQSIIQNFSSENWAKGVIKALNTVCG